MEPDTHVEQDAPVSHPGGAVQTGVIGSLVALWWGLDGVVQLAVIVLAAWLNPLIVFVAALIVLTVINIACCNWIEHHWDGWMASVGKRLEKKLDKMRSGRLMRRPVAWITHGSDGWFGLAAALTNAITTITVARLIGGQPISRRRILIASGSFALFVAGLGSLLGFALSDAIRSL